MLRILKKLEIELSLIQQFPSGYFLKENIQTQKDIYIPMFITSLFTIAKTREQFVSTNELMGKENVICIYTKISIIHKKE